MCLHEYYTRTYIRYRYAITHYVFKSLINQRTPPAVTTNTTATTTNDTRCTDTRLINTARYVLVR